LGLIVQIFATLAGFIVLCRICFNSHRKSTKTKNQQKTHRNLLIAFMVFSILSYVMSVVTATLGFWPEFLVLQLVWLGGFLSLLFSIRIAFLLKSTCSDQFQFYPKKNEIFNSLFIWSFLNCIIILAEVIIKILVAIDSWYAPEVPSISAVFSFVQLIITLMICYSAHEHRTIQRKLNNDDFKQLQATEINNQDEIRKNEEPPPYATLSDTEPLLPLKI
jgi:hypothetical protein